MHGWKVPEVDRSEVAVYAEPLLAEHIARSVGVSLLRPSPDWLATVPVEWKGREVILTTLREARRLDQERFVKSAAGKEFEAAVYAHGNDLPREEKLDGNLAVLVQGVVRWEVEYRCFVLDRWVKTTSAYWRHGRSAQQEDGTWARDEVAEASQFCQSFLDESGVELPRSCVVDVGMIEGRGWAVIESNAAWSSGLYGCDGERVLEVLREGCGRF